MKPFLWRLLHPFARSHKEYDRDLRFVRRCIWVLVAVNGFMLGVGVYRRNWWDVIAFFIWILNLNVWLDITRCQQMGRDHARLIEAELDQVIGKGWKD